MADQPRIRQHGEQSNNAAIVISGTGNTANVRQAHGSFRDRAEELDIDPGSISQVSSSYLRRTSTVTAGAALSLPLLGVVADVTGVATYFGLPRFALALIVVLGVIAVLLTNYNNFRLLCLRFAWRGSGMDPYVGEGEFAEIAPDGGMTLYRRIGRCFYPRGDAECGGAIVTTDAPPRERHQRKYVGVCSIGGWDHSYSVTPDAVATPCVFDTRPLPQDSSGNRS